MIKIVLEDDVAIRPIARVLDPTSPPDLHAAFADRVVHVMPDFGAWAQALGQRLKMIYPADVRLAPDQSALRQALPDADVVVVEALTIGKLEIDLAPRLQLVQKFGVNSVNVDAAVCETRGIALRTLRRRQNTAVAEHAFALLMALAKRLTHINRLVTPNRLKEAGQTWGRIVGLSLLHNQTLGIIGLGEIGREVAKMAKGFEMDIVYTQRNRLSAEVERTLGIRYASLDDLLSQSDAVTIHLPLSASTRHILNKEKLSKLKSGALLINTSRADIIEPKALFDCLESGKIGGAAFDVHYSEPAQEDYPLLKFKNVLLTPHLAGASRLNVLFDIEQTVFSIEDGLLRMNGVGTGT